MPTPSARRPRVTPYEEASRAHDPLTRLRAHMLSTVVGVVPASLATFATVSRRLTPEPTLLAWQAGAVAWPLRRLWPRYLERIEPHDPLAPRRVARTSNSVLLLSDLGDEPLPQAYAEHLDQLGAAAVACLYLRAAGSIAAQISLVRGGAESPFSGHDAVLLRRVRPLLEQAYASALECSPDPAPDSRALAGLTSREAEVAELVGAGARNAEIACRLAMSPATVKTHLTQVYAKLGVRSRTQLAVTLRSRADLIGSRGP